MTRTARALFIALLLAIAAAAQVRENVTVEVVEVPVYVIAPDGSPIRGLTKDSFELRVNGRMQPIDSFDAVDLSASASPSGAAAPAAPRERRLYLLLFDCYFSLPNPLARARRAAEFLVDHANPDTDLFAVATYTSNEGVQFQTAFLRDRVAIKRAIATLRPSEMQDALAVATTPVERAALALDSSRGRVDPDTELADAVRGGAAFQELHTDELRHRIDEQMTSFAGVAKRLSGLEGQKHVLWLSSGFSAALLHGGSRATPKDVLSAGGLDAHSLRIFSESTEAFNAAGVFLDSVDISGIRPDSDNESLQIVAQASGGQFVHNRNDLGEALLDLQRKQSVTYLLTFRRPNARPGTIDVKVHGVPRGTRLSYRRGFGKEAQATSIDPLQLADIVVNDVPQRGMTVHLGVVERELVCSIDAREVIPQLDRKMPFVDAIVYVFDSTGAAVLTKALRWNAEAEPLQWRERLVLPPGRYVAKAVTAIAGTPSPGFARTEFTVE